MASGKSPRQFPPFPLADFAVRKWGMPSQRTNLTWRVRLKRHRSGDHGSPSSGRDARHPTARKRRQSRELLGLANYRPCCRYGGATGAAIAIRPAATPPSRESRVSKRPLDDCREHRLTNDSLAMVRVQDTDRCCCHPSIVWKVQADHGYLASNSPCPHHRDQPSKYSTSSRVLSLLPLTPHGISRACPSYCIYIHVCAPNKPPVSSQ